MPLFRYLAVNTLGRSIKGVIDADSLSVAKERLRKQQILVTSVIPIKSKQDEQVLTRPLLLSFTREIAQLLKAGLPLYESLLTIEEKHRKNKAHPLFLSLCDYLREGALLSTALKSYPSTFDRIYLSMVQVAEQSGNLATIFEQLAQLIARQQKLKKQLVSTLAYPTFLAFFCFLVVCGLLFFVIPSVKELFDGRIMHPVTELVLALSNWANDNVPLLLGFFGCILISPFLILRSVSAKLYIYKLSLRLPLFKTLILHSALVRFCRSLGMLLSGSVPLLEALSLSKNVVKSPLLEEAITLAEKRVGSGERLSAAFAGAPLIPSLVMRMLSLAEETGKMGDAFVNLSEIYEEEMEKHLSQLSTFLQPALLIVLGAVVGLVVLSILLPLTDVSSFN